MYIHMYMLWASIGFNEAELSGQASIYIYGIWRIYVPTLAQDQDRDPGRRAVGFANILRL